MSGKLARVRQVRARVIAMRGRLRAGVGVWLGLGLGLGLRPPARVAEVFERVDLVVHVTLLLHPGRLVAHLPRVETADVMRAPSRAADRSARRPPLGI